jgi:Flp pilus assembly protein TadD
MTSRSAQVLVLLAACVACLQGCSTATKLGDLGKSNDQTATADAKGDFPTAAATTNGGEVTGSVNVQPAEPGLLGSHPDDDLALGKRYFRSNNFALAEKAFRTAVEKHPHDAEAWVGLAASYDRLHRFDLADRAYAEAIRIVGSTAEILNDQGFSYMLRGDFARAQKKLQDAQLKDPANPYIQANLRLLQDSYREGKSVQ